MKSLFFAFILLLGASSQAGILNSNLNPRHQKAIEDAVLAQCGAINLNQVTLSSVVDPAELGDEYFYIDLKGMVRYEQNLFEEVNIAVKSVMVSQYDHSAQEWGYFEVKSVTCTPAL